MYYIVGFCYYNDTNVKCFYAFRKFRNLPMVQVKYGCRKYRKINFNDKMKIVHSDGCTIGYEF